jgi:Mrp family chromosome partitioning ATPase
MSKNALVLERTASTSLSARPEIARAIPHAGEYLQLIRRHFQTRSVVAIVAVGSAEGTGDVCDNLAAELAASDTRVVIASVEALLRTNSMSTPEESGCTPGRSPNVWLWPSVAAGQMEFFKPRSPADPTGRWLDSLRLTFDAVLLDCPSTERVPAGAEFAAMADAAVLVVEAKRTTKQQIRSDQYALQLKGVKLAGCILVGRR